MHCDKFAKFIFRNGKPGALVYLFHNNYSTIYLRYIINENVTTQCHRWHCHRHRRYGIQHTEHSDSDRPRAERKWHGQI